MADPDEPLDQGTLLDQETLSSLERLARGRADFLPRLMRTFVQQGAQLVAEARTAADAGDPAALEASVHKLGGSCGQIGATRLRSRCIEVERAARQGDVDGNAVAAVERAFEALAHHIEQRFVTPK